MNGSEEVERMWRVQKPERKKNGLLRKLPVWNIIEPPDGIDDWIQGVPGSGKLSCRTTPFIRNVYVMDSERYLWDKNQNVLVPVSSRPEKAGTTMYDNDKTISKASIAGRMYSTALDMVIEGQNNNRSFDLGRRKTVLSIHVLPDFLEGSYSLHTCPSSSSNLVVH